MKIFSAGKGKPLDRNAAMALAALNLLATPGLGTILAGKFFAGLAQLTAAVGGCGLILAWYYALLRDIVMDAPRGPAWIGLTGLSLFGIGWLGSLWSSLNFVREASSRTPPKLDGTPG